jgi:hypothetical protein
MLCRQRGQRLLIHLRRSFLRVLPHVQRAELTHDFTHYRVNDPESLVNSRGLRKAVDTA